MKDRPMRSLVVEDNPGDVGLLRVMLEGGRNLRVVAYVSTMREAEIFLSANDVDVVLLDLGLPDAQGLEALRRARAAAPGTPLVILSGQDDERLALEAVHEGAQDYLIKGQIESGALLRALRYAIERRSLEAAAEVLSDKVQVARDEAEAATVIKANFVSNMSHEIRTPLHSIIGFSELLLDDNSLNHRQRRYLELVKNAGGALLTVVNDILDFSKLDAGKMTLVHEDFSLETLIRSTVSIIEGSAVSKGLGLDLFIDPELTLHNRGDSARLRQIILNLLSNAVKFTPSGKINLDTRKISSDAMREIVRFTVLDTGPGVKPEWQPRLFQQFFQADASASREHGGTGLGLSICKSLVELMGGRIGYQESEAGGSVFWFEIELERASKLEMKLEGCQPTSRLAGLKVLLVEDVPMNQELACAILRRGGHEVEIAGDGAEAVAAARERTFDVILMDIQMPNMDGVTATRQIRQLSGPARHTPIIAVTANAMPEQVLEYYRAGMVAHLAKPFTPREMNDAIRRAVSPMAKWQLIDSSINDRNPTETGDEDRDCPTLSSGGTLRRGTEKAVEISSHSRDTCFGEGRAAVAAESIFDPQILAKVKQLISPKRVVEYMLDLDEDLARLAVSSIDEPTLESQAHRIISQAGMLGLMRISNCARALSNACRSEEGRAEALLHFQEAAGDLKLYAAPAAGIAFNVERGAHD